MSTMTIMENQKICKKDLVGYKTIKQVNQHNAMCDFLEQALAENHTKIEREIRELKEKIATLRIQEDELKIELEKKLENHGFRIQISPKQESEHGAFDGVVGTATWILNYETAETKRIYKKSDGSWIEIRTEFLDDDHDDHNWDRTTTEIEVLQK